MSEEIEKLDSQNQDVEENNEKENLNTQTKEDNNGKDNEDDKVTLSKKDYETLIGQKEYYQTQYKKIKQPVEKQTKKENISDDRTVVLEIRQDYPQLTKEEAIEIADKAKKVATLEGKQISEALNDDYVKSSIQAKLQKKASEEASISSNRSPKGLKPGTVNFKPNMKPDERKVAYQKWLAEQGR